MRQDGAEHQAARLAYVAGGGGEDPLLGPMEDPEVLRTNGQGDKRKIEGSLGVQPH
jgi:hypothetical protein